MKTPVIAIDGGGTHCRLALDDGRSVWRAGAGPANVSSDFEGALGEIRTGLTRLADAAGLPTGALADMPAHIGLAGVTGAEIRACLSAELPLRRAQITDDRPAALRGALGPDDGMIAHCGTGSFLAAQSGGSMRFAGGWGPVLGDEASAQNLGRRALSLALATIDGLAAPSAMSGDLLTRYGGADGIVAFAGRADPAALGAIAPLVTGHAAKGDALARMAMQEAAAAIAATLPALGWVPGMPICLTGGIGPHYAAYLPDDMQTAIRKPAQEPIDGALALARAFADGFHL